MRNKAASSGAFQNFVQRVFLTEKLNNRIGFALILLIAAVFGVLLSYDLVIGLGFFAAIVSFFILFLCIHNSEAGLYIITIYAFSASALARFVFQEQFPVGVVNDILILGTFVGLFFSEGLKENAHSFFKSRPIVFYSIILIYLTLELANPLAHSFGGWLHVMRKILGAFIVTFIAYNVFSDIPKIRRFFHFLFSLTLILGLYGCFQQWFGLSRAEINWVNADPLRFGLINIWGEYRKFSLLAGPTEFGVIMAGCSLLFLLIGVNERSRVTKILYIVGSVFMILGMSYSGTRTANAMLVGGIGLYLMLTINKTSSKILACFTVLAFLFIMYAPIYSSATFLRFRSTFSASQDASYNVREINRQSVQPFIWSHPFGGGLSTTGEMGQKYNPGHPIAGFPPDSSYLNKALESGWVGMILTLLLYFFTMQYVVSSYFATKNNDLKMFFAASAAFFFSYYIGELTQEVVGVFSNMGVYFPLFAIILRLVQFARSEHITTSGDNHSTLEKY